MGYEDDGDASRAVVAVLAAAAGVGAVITRTKLAKLLYLSDLRAVESLGQPMSGVRWQWLNHGPFDYDLLGLEARLVALGKVGRVEQANPFGTPEYRLTLVDDVVNVNIDSKFWEIVRGVVAEFGSYAASSLRDITYQTAPMIEAQKRGQRGVELDLDIIRPMPDAKAAVSRLLRKVGQLPVQDTEDGAMEDLACDIRSLAKLRKRANRQLLS